MYGRAGCLTTNNGGFRPGQCNGVGGSNDGCRKFAKQQQSAGLPVLWTEDEQWYDRFGQAQSLRNTSSSARGMAAFVALGGSLHNFCESLATMPPASSSLYVAEGPKLEGETPFVPAADMWHGGNMYGNWSDTDRGSHLTPGYANSAPMASDGSVSHGR